METMDKIIHGDALEVLKTFPENSVDSVVTDPPYGLGFLKKIGDGFNHCQVKYQEFSFRWAKEVIRVLKPGGHLLSFGGTRTYHRMVCGIEDAGFEIRDCILWIYGSGFPKSLDIGKAVDKLRGGETNNTRWKGWGTGLKPAVEPIVVARKPISEKNVALNVLRWGTGGLNIDKCRVDNEIIMSKGSEIGKGFFSRGVVNRFHVGRYPANVILECICGCGENGENGENVNTEEKTTVHTNPECPCFYLGGASRFFYQAKPSQKEREIGGVENTHLTVKPLKLMRYLVRLVTPPGGVVLDPFLGSGTTALACVEEGFHWIGIEKEKEYVKIAEARIEGVVKKKCQELTYF